MSLLIELKNEGGEGTHDWGKVGCTFLGEDLPVPTQGHASAASSISVTLPSALRATFQTHKGAASWAIPLAKSKLRLKEQIGRCWACTKDWAEGGTRETRTLQASWGTQANASCRNWYAPATATVWGPGQFNPQAAKKHHLRQQKWVPGLAITALRLVEQPGGSRAWGGGKQQNCWGPPLWTSCLVHPSTLCLPRCTQQL